MVRSHINAQVKQTVIIVTADKNLAEQLNMALQVEGYAVFSANDSVSGMTLIYDTLPHLVLLDVTLQDGEGYGVIDKIRAEPLLNKALIILMSTNGTAINMRRIAEGSITEYIVTLGPDIKNIVAHVNKRLGHIVPEPVQKIEEKKTILWVEDDKLIGSILSRKFLSSGFNLIHAKNGEEALTALESQVPDIIVLDLLLPGMSGFEILEKIKQNEKNKGIPVMILSNLSKKSDVEKATNLGADKFFVKAAISLDEIVKEVRGMCA